MNNEEKEIDLRDYIRIGIKHRKIIIAIPLIAGIVSALLSLFVLPEVFQSGAVLRMLYLFPTERGFRLAFDEGMIKNKRIEQELIQKLNLDPAEVTPDSLDGQIEIKIEEKSGIIRIITQASSPQLAADIANTLADLAVQDNQSLIEQQSRGGQNGIYSQLMAGHKKLLDSEQKLLEARKKANLDSLDKEKSILLSQKGDWELEYESIQKELVDLKAQLKSLEKELAQQEKLLVMKQSLVQSPAFQQSLAKMTREQIQALAETQFENEQLNSVYQNLVQRRANINISIAGLEAKQTKLEHSLAENEAKLRKIVKEIADKNLRLDRLSRTVSINKNNYLSLADQHDAVQTAIRNQVGQLSIVARAVPPLQHIKPKRKLNVLVAGFLGLIVGIIWAFGAEYLKEGIS